MLSAKLFTPFTLFTLALKLSSAQEEQLTSGTGPKLPSAPLDHPGETTNSSESFLSPQFGEKAAATSVIPPSATDAPSAASVFGNSDAVTTQKPSSATGAPSAASVFRNKAAATSVIPPSATGAPSAASVLLTSRVEVSSSEGDIDEAKRDIQLATSSLPGPVAKESGKPGEKEPIVSSAIQLASPAKETGNPLRAASMQPSGTATNGNENVKTVNLDHIKDFHYHSYSSTVSSFSSVLSGLMQLTTFATMIFASFLLLTV